MGQPGPPFPFVDAQGLQTPEQVVREGLGPSVPVVANEHPDAPGLPVGAHLELGTLGPGGGVTHRAGHGLEVASGPGAEEGQRDVEVSGRHEPPVEFAQLPGGDGLDDVVGQTQRAEEAKPCTGIDRSGRGVTCVCQFCVNSRRTRWSAAAAARERTAARSDG